MTCASLGKSSVSRPFATIAIPTIDRLAYLRETLASALSQKGPTVEIIVSDNRSADGTAEFLKQQHDQRLRIVTREERLPMVAHWNTLLAAAAGEYFLLLSDDDLLAPDFMACCSEALAANEAGERPVNLIHGSTKIIDAAGNESGMWYDDSIPRLEEGETMLVNWFRNRRPYAFCSTLYRTELLRETGGFDEEICYAADAAARVRLALGGLSLYVPQAFSSYRLHSGNASTRQYGVLDRLRCNLGIVSRAVAAVRDPAIAALLRQAGEKYAKTVFISESAVAAGGGISPASFLSFAWAYQQQFGWRTLLFFDLWHYLRRVLQERSCRRTTAVAKLSPKCPTRRPARGQ